MSVQKNKATWGHKVARVGRGKGSQEKQENTTTQRPPTEQTVRMLTYFVIHG